MVSKHRLRVAVAVLGSTLIVLLGLMAVRSPAGTVASNVASTSGSVSSSGAMAHAPAAATTYKGKVIARSGLNVRKAPTSKAAVIGGQRRGQIVNIDCKVPGPYVGGNARWYNLSSGGWVTARYVDNIGTAPRWCGGSYKGKVVAKSGLRVRTGPDTSNARITTLKSGQRVTIGCKVDGDVIGGNARWYWVHLSGRDGWVAARYVANIGAIPARC